MATKDRKSVMIKDRRSSLTKVNQGDSQMQLLKGVVLSSSYSTASSLQDLMDANEEIVKDRRADFVKGESNTKLLQGFSSSETTSSSLTNKSPRNKHGILVRAASFFPSVRENSKSTRGILRVSHKKKEDKKRRTPTQRLPDVTPPEFIFIPTNSQVSLSIEGGRAVMRF